MPFDALSQIILVDRDEPLVLVWPTRESPAGFVRFEKASDWVAFIADLGNLINEIYTAPFNTTLTATFLNDEQAPDAADVIVPISARQGSQNKPSAWSIPETPASLSVQLPQNIKKAVEAVHKGDVRYRYVLTDFGEQFTSGKSLVQWLG